MYIVMLHNNDFSGFNFGPFFIADMTLEEEGKKYGTNFHAEMVFFCQKTRI